MPEWFRCLWTTQPDAYAVTGAIIGLVVGMVVSFLPPFRHPNPNWDKAIGKLIAALSTLGGALVGEFIRIVWTGACG
jgi:hypothetical protein